METIVEQATSVVKKILITASFVQLLINLYRLPNSSIAIYFSERLCEYNVRVGSFNWLTDDGGHHMDIEPELVVKHKDFGKGCYLDSSQK